MRYIRIFGDVFCWALISIASSCQFSLAFAMTPSVSEEQVLRPKIAFKDCDSCPEMMVIASGSFLMGSTDRGNDEQPAHRVSIRKFALATFEITLGNWVACAAQNACVKIKSSEPQYDTNPLVNVSWDEAQQYIAWLSKMTGKRYRLPSEAEWEYSARAGGHAEPF